MGEGEIAFFTINSAVLPGWLISSGWVIWRFHAHTSSHSHTLAKTHTWKYTTFCGSILARERSMDRHARQTLLSALKREQRSVMSPLIAMVRRGIRGRTRGKHWSSKPCACAFTFVCVCVSDSQRDRDAKKWNMREWRWEVSGSECNYQKSESEFSNLWKLAD